MGPTGVSETTLSLLSAPHTKEPVPVRLACLALYHRNNATRQRFNFRVNDLLPLT